MTTVYMVKVPQAWRAAADAALRAMDRARACYIEAQGYCDGSTSWGLIVAVFNRKWARDTNAFRAAFREQMGARFEQCWCDVQVYHAQELDESNIKRGNPEGEQHG